jgi:hypothetical protein
MQTRYASRYVSLARTREELLHEFLSDIQRRLDDLDKYLRTQSRSAAEATRIARARNELLDIQDYWNHVDLKTNGDKEE